MVSHTGGLTGESWKVCVYYYYTTAGADTRYAMHAMRQHHVTETA